MATAIKAIPTLYGEEATRFRRMAGEAENRYQPTSVEERNSAPFVISMRNMLRRSGMPVMQ